MLTKVTFRATFIMLCTMLSAGAYAIADAPRRVDIPAGELSVALLKLSKQYGADLVYRPEQVYGLKTHGAHGSLTTEQAVTQLLQGTVLELRTDQSGAMLIAPPASGSAQASTAPSQDASDASKEGKKNSSGEFRVAQVDRGQTSGVVSLAAQALDSRATPSGGLSEIIVTAQKREERLQDVPVPVTAIAADTLIQQNDLRLEDYYSKVPGLSLSTSEFGWPMLSIRGLTTGGATNPTVGVTVDDVPYGSSTAIANGQEVPDLDPSDLARIEVLRGPQGTLYGASSLGGLLKFVTVDPSTEALTGDVQGDSTHVSNGANLGYSFRGSINVPVNDTLAIRASGFTRRDPGYVDNVLIGAEGVNRVDTSGGRLSALWRPVQDLTVKLSALVQHSSADGVQTVDQLPGLGDLQQSRAAGTGVSNKTLQAYSATITGKLGAVNVTSVSGYNIKRYSDSLDVSYALGPYIDSGVQGSGFNGFGVAGAPNVEHVNTKRFTQELRFSGSIGEPFDWLLGGFYNHEKTDYTQNILASDLLTGAIAGVFANIPTPSTFSEYAAFADLTYHLNERFDIQFGGRESHNHQTLNESISGPYALAFLGSSTPVIYPEVDTSDNSFTYLVTPRLKISPDLMVYARLSSGYRPGGPNYNLGGTPPEYAPDKTQNYELGVKGNALGRLLSFDASVYYINWKNIQLQLENQLFETYYANGSKAKSQGIELSLESRPLEGLTLSTWVDWNDAELTQSLPADSAAYGSAGDRLPYSSRFSGSASVDQHVSLASHVAGFIGATVSYVGNREGVLALISSGSPQRQVFPAYAKTDLRAGLVYDTWKLNLFATNVTNRRGVIGGGIGTVPPWGFMYIQPRLVGFSIDKTF
jgi:iron complex outermembrane receptor protein